MQICHSLTGLFVLKNSKFNIYHFQSKKNDSNRLANRGGALLKEEKIRKGINRELPKVSKSISHNFTIPVSIIHCQEVWGYLYLYIVLFVLLCSNAYDMIAFRLNKNWRWRLANGRRNTSGDFSSMAVITWTLLRISGQRSMLKKNKRNWKG